MPGQRQTTAIRVTASDISQQLVLTAGNKNKKMQKRRRVPTPAGQQETLQEGFRVAVVIFLTPVQEHHLKAIQVVPAVLMCVGSVLISYPVILKLGGLS